MGRYRKTRREKNIKKDETTGDWIVYKTFKKLKEPYIYQRFKTLRDAKKYRDQLDKNNAWKTELPDNLRIKIENKGKNYYQQDKTWIISKTINHIIRYYGAYQNSYTARKVAQALKKNNWNYNQLSDDLKQLNIASEDSYCQVNNNFTINKISHDGFKNYGTYTNLEDAEKVVEYLKKNNWPNTLPPELKQLQKNKKEFKYYSKKQNGKYQIYKHLNGKAVHFGVYETEEEAQKAVELLKQNNWNKDNIQIK